MAYTARPATLLMPVLRVMLLRWVLTVFTAMLSRDLEKHAMIEELLLVPQEDYNLSDREMDVLELVAQGLSSKEIASRLNIAVNTVNTHRKSITRKTGIKSVAGLAVYAMLKK